MSVVKELAILLVVGSTLSGCIVKPDAAAIGPYPDNFKQIIREYVEKSFFDPYSMKSVALSYPTEGHIFFNQGWIVCLQANAKNRFGAYTGLRTTAYLINNYKVTQTMADAPMCQSAQISFSSWDMTSDTSSFSLVDLNSPSIEDKTRWIQALAKKNECVGQQGVSLKRKEETTEVYSVACAEETMEFTCSFDGSISLDSDGVPNILIVTLNSFSTKPACWISSD